ncbi:PAAR domain-containing protein [Pseudoduganella sp. UC29_106]|uniref:PAAR domain-containing protein n=1 Tax=Pseudoduganella sp. UC29_106 TaxID=3374553 RepID=UPI0037575B1C
MRAVICKGDRTSHGGRVLEGNPNVTTGGRPIAQLGHATICPLCKGKFPIVEGVATHTYGGKPTAVEGMHTACGAILIASQREMVIDAGGGGGGGSSDSAVSSAPGQVAAAESDEVYSGAFRAVDESTGEPVAGLPYRIELSDGRILRGVTDAGGYTQRVSHHEALTMSLHWENEE